MALRFCYKKTIIILLEQQIKLANLKIATRLLHVWKMSRDIKQTIGRESDHRKEKESDIGIEYLHFYQNHSFCLKSKWFDHIVENKYGGVVCINMHLPKNMLDNNR